CDILEFLEDGYAPETSVKIVSNAFELAVGKSKFTRQLELM
nr:hypothetical protein [Tanacetum cinerariifolium]